MIVGSSIAVGGIVVHQLIDDFFINGQMFWGIAMGASTLCYIGVSLLGKRTDFDFDALFHRGRYAVSDDKSTVSSAPKKGLKLLGIDKEFTKGDKFIYIITYTMILGWTLVFVLGTIYNLTHDVPDESWASFWRIYVLIQLAIASATVVWFTIGGVKDLRAMLKRLAVMERDDSDDGVVRDRTSSER